MFPGKINPKQMQSMMKAMGIKSDSLEVERVTIELSSKKIVMEKPNVTVIEAQGQKTYTVMGSEKIEELGASSEDIELVCQKTGCSKERAKQALQESGGDIAQAILSIRL